MIVRSARSEDIGAVLSLWGQARSRVAQTMDDEDAVARLLQRDAEALLVAEREGEVVGALIAAWDGWRGNMYRLAVAPEVRRQGVATELVVAGHERLRALGALRITAPVGRDDAGAVALWRAAGYAHDELVVRFVRDL